MLAALLIAITCFYGNLARESYTDDFRAFYVAAEATAAHLDPYVNHVNLDERFADALWLRPDSRFIYPPTALFFFLPLAHVPYNLAKTAFGLLMALTMVAILAELHRRYPRQTLVLLALFISLPMFMHVDNGQIDCLILGLVLVAFYLPEGWRGGVCLGIAIAIKVSPVLLLVWFVSQRRWRLLAWCAATVGVLAAAAYVHWGAGYFIEFAQHLARHGEGQQLLTHTFVTLHKIGNPVLVTADGIFAYQHDIGGYQVNPLHLLGRVGMPIGLGLYLALACWLLSPQARRLSDDRRFFLLLVGALVANPLLWAMGLVACFPLVVLLVSESPTPNRAAVMLVAPFLLTKQAIGEGSFVLWLAMAGLCLWQNGWFRRVPEGDGGLRQDLPATGMAA